MVRSSELDIDGAATDLLIAITKAVGGTVYLSGDGAAGYQDDARFAQHGLELQFQNFTPEPYPQLGSKEFVPGLSALDASSTWASKARPRRSTGHPGRRAPPRRRTRPASSSRNAPGRRRRPVPRRQRAPRVPAVHRPPRPSGRVPARPRRRVGSRRLPGRADRGGSRDRRHLLLPAPSCSLQPLGPRHRGHRARDRGAGARCRPGFRPTFYDDHLVATGYQDLAAAERAWLSQLLDCPVDSVSFHQFGVLEEAPPDGHRVAGMVNAYGSAIAERFATSRTSTASGASTTCTTSWPPASTTGCTR